MLTVFLAAVSHRSTTLLRRGFPAVALSFVTASVSAANCTAPVVDGQLYSIASVSSGRVLDVEAGATTQGAALQQWGYAGAGHQQFVVRSTGDGYWTIQARHSAMLLDVASQSVADGGRVIQWPATGKYNQQWQLKKSTTGGYNIVARHSG